MTDSDKKNDIYDVKMTANVIKIAFDRKMTANDRK